MYSISSSKISMPIQIRFLQIEIINNDATMAIFLELCLYYTVNNVMKFHELLIYTIKNFMKFYVLLSYTI